MRPRDGEHVASLVEVALTELQTDHEALAIAGHGVTNEVDGQPSDPAPASVLGDDGVAEVAGLLPQRRAAVDPCDDPGADVLGPRAQALGLERLPSVALREIAPEELGVDLTPRLKVLKVVEPKGQRSGTRVATVAELVDKLKNEAQVL